MKNRENIKESMFIAIVSTLLHFTYDILGKCVYLAPFMPVNESIFEHLKLPLYGTIVYVVIKHIYNKKINFNQSYFTMYFCFNYKLCICRNF